MSLRANGSYIGPRPTGPSSAAASGIWDLRTVERQRAANNWPGQPITDPYFASVSLLLHMDGSNGSTTLTDSSAYSRSVTAYGNAALSTAQSKFGGSSLYLDGDGDYVTVASASGTAFGTGDFTIEYFVRSANVGNVWPTIDGESGGIMIRQNSGALLSYSRPQGDPPIFSAGTLTANQWQHVAVVRSAGTVSGYIDGARVAQASNSDNYTSTVFTIGKFYDSSSYWFNGYLDEIRVSKVARYSGATITVPTSAFPEAVPGTDPLFSSVSLLLHMDGSNGSTTFTDSSASPKTVTANGNAAISTGTKKFGTGSLALDGSGDYLSVANSSALDFGTGDFAVEFWIFFTSSVSTSQQILYSETNGGWFIGLFNAGEIGIGRAGTAWDHYASHSMTTNTWNHIAVARAGTSLRIFVNGSQVGSTYTNSQSYTLAGGALRIGGTGPEYNVTGYIDDVRITKGTARGYTGATITVPTAAFPDA